MGGLNGQGFGSFTQRKTRARTVEEKNGAPKRSEGSVIVTKIERVLFTYRETLAYYHELLEQMEESFTNNGAMFTVNDSYKAIQTSYEKSLSELQRCIYAMEKQLRTIPNEFTVDTSNMERVIAEYEEKLRILDTQFTDIDNSLYKQINLLSTLMQNQKEQFEKQNLQLEVLKQQYEDQKLLFEEQKQQVSEQRKFLDSQPVLLNELRRQIEEQKEMLYDYRAEMNLQREEYYQQLKDQITEHQIIMEEQKSLIEEQRAQINDYRAQMDVHIAKLKQVQEQKLVPKTERNENHDDKSFAQENMKISSLVIPYKENSVETQASTMSNREKQYAGGLFGEPDLLIENDFLSDSEFVSGQDYNTDYDLNNNMYLDSGFLSGEEAYGMKNNDYTDYMQNDVYQVHEQAPSQTSITEETNQRSLLQEQDTGEVTKIEDLEQVLNKYKEILEIYQEKMDHIDTITNSIYQLSNSHEESSLKEVENMLNDYRQALAFYKDTLKRYDNRLSEMEEAAEKGNAQPPNAWASEYAATSDMEYSSGMQTAQTTIDLAFIKDSISNLAQKIDELTGVGAIRQSQPSVYDKAFSENQQNLDSQSIIDEIMELRRRMDDLIKFVAKLDGSIVENVKTNTSISLAQINQKLEMVLASKQSQKRWPVFLCSFLGIANIAGIAVYLLIELGIIVL